MPEIFSNTPTNFGLTKALRRRLEEENQSNNPLSTSAKVLHDHSYCSKSKSAFENAENEDTDRPALQETLKRKIRSLQQQVRRTKARQQTMADVIHELQQKQIIEPDDAEVMHSKFNGIQLSIFRDTKNNVSCAPCGRRYSDPVKEFATTLHYYSPKAYQYVRSILPLPNPSLIRKWSSVLECDPGFVKEAFESLGKEASTCPEKKDCFLVIDAMSTRKQSLWDPKQDKYVGFVDYGPIASEKPNTLASEAVVFLLVGARSHWKCPIGYFLADKMSSKNQAQLVRIALQMAAETGLRVWSITTDGTSVNISTFRELGCNFTTSFDSMVTKFKHPSEDYYVYVILDPCHMLKLARNALGTLKSFVDEDENLIQWNVFQALDKIQESEGFTLANKLSKKHVQFQKHKMNVRLAAQTLSSSVADAIEFLNVSMKLTEFQNSDGTVKFVRMIDRLFDMLNSRNPLGKGYKQPLRPASKDTWEEILRSTATYLLSLKTNTDAKQPLSTHPRKTFVIGFVASIKSTIEMANEMFSTINPFKYLLTYKYSQDHIELLFSCIRARGGWNNNPNCLQFKYAMRKMLLRNAITASKNANCQNFPGVASYNIIPFFHTRKHKAPLNNLIQPDVNTTEHSAPHENTPEEIMMLEHFNTATTSEFLANVLFYIGGYIVSKLVQEIECPSCKSCLLSSFSLPTTDHDYCGMKYNEVSRASAFTLFINNGGLRIPSQSVYQVVEFAEKVFKAYVCKEGRSITREKKLRQRMIMDVCQHFVMDSKHVFDDHQEGANENVFEDDHRTLLIKFTADKYFTLRLFTYSKRYNETVVTQGKQSDRHQLTKLILFRNQ